MTLNWHDTNGGPFAAVPSTALPQWTGTEGDDYDRACEIVDGVAVLMLAGGDEALVFGDEPMSTTVLPEHGVIARWCYAETEEGVADLITDSLAATEWIDGPEMRTTGPLVIFDSAYLGTEVGTLTEGITLDLDAGRYRVESTVIEPDSKTRFLLNRFVPLA
ncbi:MULTISPECIES: Imm21 family immunity protein [unclassified Streptomyces]|uniref:Immunity 21 family protein n=1 Tax=Streptomyces sp. NBC_00119 TaxID=2975659 RepID=A0AAU1ULL7_9ACTN|nr:MULTISPECIES: Imm21 family immunity protein [unclassified Streptomyces]MCX4649468.1 immunity 21 family protein [Streptomyces sp. NBC_01446]MCX5321331.1 immunity 21 family protein [Streptomyces sp. NBC_00120]